MIKPGLLRNVAAVGSVLALSLLLLALSARDSYAQTCPPTCNGTFTPTGTLNLGTGAANTASDINTHLNIPAQDMIFGGNIAFTPLEWGVASAGDLAIGTAVGRLDSVATLGLLNGPCATVLPVGFDLLNGSVNTADTISGLPPGTSNRLQPLVDDVSPANGVPDGADHYPDYLNTLFPGINPRARLVGFTIIGSADNLPVVLNFDIFEPGTQIPESDLLQDPPGVDVRLGYPSVTVLQDPTEPAAPSAVTDFCAPLTATTSILANIRTNPGPGTYIFAGFTRSQRDADGDGTENILDTCPFTPNNENPKSSDPLQNPDVDGIDSACDNTSVFTDGENTIPWSATSLCRASASDDFFGLDCDQDGFLNRGDNCPQDANIDQADNDSDGIGNVCDPNPNTPDGAFIELGLARCVTIPGDGTSVACDPPTVEGCTGLQPFGNCPLLTSFDTSDNPDNPDNPDTPDTPDPNVPTEIEQQQSAKEDVLASLTVGLNISAGLDTVPTGGSTPVVASCAEEQNGLKPISGADITFEIDSQPGSDADLDGQAKVTVTSDAEGFAEATLNVGSSVGDIVVSAAGVGCGPAKTTTVTVGQALAETTDPDGSPDTGVGSLAPIAASIPAWAAIASGLGGAGLLGSLGAMAARILRRRRQ